MAIELQYAASRYELLKRESQAKEDDLKKALEAAKETHFEIRAAREELRQAGDIAAGKPFLLRMKFGDPKYAPLEFGRRVLGFSKECYWCDRVFQRSERS